MFFFFQFERCCGCTRKREKKEFLSLGGPKGDRLSPGQNHLDKKKKKKKKEIFCFWQKKKGGEPCCSVLKKKLLFEAAENENW